MVITITPNLVKHNLKNIEVKTEDLFTTYGQIMSLLSSYDFYIPAYLKTAILLDYPGKLHSYIGGLEICVYSHSIHGVSLKYFNILNTFVKVTA